MSQTKFVIIGRPNVGKSSLFNRIVGARKAIVHGISGTTRDFIEEVVSENGRSFKIIDTAGYSKDKDNVFSEAALNKVREAVSEADFLILTVDGNVSPTNEDKMIADVARKSKKETLLAVNKLDNSKEGALKEYERMGFKKVFPMSVIHNIGVSDLKAELFASSTKGDAASKKPEINIAIIGRPNVGKSSILNAMLKKNRALVSEVPGTTRDVVSDIIPSKTTAFRLSDTAGARKPGKIGKAFKKGEPVEKYSYLRTKNEIENSDIVLVVLDASEKIAAQDLHIAGMAKELGKGIILVINKWDLVKDIDQNKFLRRLRHEFNFMIWVPAIFVSAKTGRNVEEILSIVKEVRANQTQKLESVKLERILSDFVLTNRPKGLGTYRPKMITITQTGTIPPTFTITAKFHAFVHFAWRRALENEMRRHFDFTGTPVKIVFRGKKL